MCLRNLSLRAAATVCFWIALPSFIAHAQPPASPAERKEAAKAKAAQDEAQKQLWKALRRTEVAAMNAYLANGFGRVVGATPATAVPSRSGQPQGSLAVMGNSVYVLLTGALYKYNAATLALQAHVSVQPPRKKAAAPPPE